jgi:hypothetical protein
MASNPNKAVIDGNPRLIAFLLLTAANHAAHVPSDNSIKGRASGKCAPLFVCGGLELAPGVALSPLG